MRRFIGLATVLVMASSALAQDTTVVVVRHLPPQQDTSVVVRHIDPQRAATPYAAPRYAPRYAMRSDAVIAKDPRFGTFLSFMFPGGGQYYADKPAMGLALTLIGIGAPIIGFNSVNHDRGYGGYGPPPGSNCFAYGGPGYYGGDCRGRTDWTPAAVGLGVGITAWLYGIATAGSDAQHWNQAHGVRFVTAPGRVGFAVAVP